MCWFETLEKDNGSRDSDWGKILGPREDYTPVNEKEEEGRRRLRKMRRKSLEPRFCSKNLEL